jgi:hypothetical protein
MSNEKMEREALARHLALVYSQRLARNSDRLSPEKEDEMRTASIEGREPDPDMTAKPDALITCVKQRNGECEPKKAAWFDVNTFQYLSGPQAKPFRYCNDFSVRAVAGGAA